MGRLLKNISIYFAGNVVNRIMGFLVMSIATYVLTDQSDFGYFSMASNMINIIMTLVCVQAWMAIIRFVFDYETPKGKMHVVATGYFIELLTFIVYSLGFLIFNMIFQVRDSIELYFLSFGYVFNQGVQFACRGLGKNKLYVASGVVGSTAQLISSIIFLFIFKMTSNALILAMSISYISQGLFIEFFLNSFKYFNHKYINLKLAKKMLKYCIPTAFNYAAYWTNQSLNVVIIGFYIGQSSAGIFSAASKMNSLIALVMIAFNFAFQEYSFSISKSNVRERMYNKVFDAFVRFISCGMMILIRNVVDIFWCRIGLLFLWLTCWLGSISGYIIQTYCSAVIVRR